MEGTEDLSQQSFILAFVVAVVVVVVVKYLQESTCKLGHGSVFKTRESGSLLLLAARVSKAEFLK